MALTIAQAQTQANENALWEGDLAKARLRLEALRVLVVERPLQTGSAAAQLTFESQLREIERLERFVDATAPIVKPSVVRADFQHFRGYGT